MGDALGHVEAFFAVDQCLLGLQAIGYVVKDGYCAVCFAVLVVEWFSVNVYDVSFPVWALDNYGFIVKGLLVV